jgi:hypothetical protein
MAELMGELSAKAGEPGQLEYTSKEAKSTCPMYVGLGQNNMGFKKWFNTKLLPRVWAPKETAGRRARDKKLMMPRFSTPHVTPEVKAVPTTTTSTTTGRRRGRQSFAAATSASVPADCD